MGNLLADDFANYKANELAIAKHKFIDPNEPLPGELIARVGQIEALGYITDDVFTAVMSALQLRDKDIAKYKSVILNPGQTLAAVLRTYNLHYHVLSLLYCTLHYMNSLPDISLDSVKTQVSNHCNSLKIAASNVYSTLSTFYALTTKTMQCKVNCADYDAATAGQKLAELNDLIDEIEQYIFTEKSINCD